MVAIQSQVLFVVFTHGSALRIWNIPVLNYEGCLTCYKIFKSLVPYALKVS